MDTIRLSANGHDILFSKKSVMIDGEEYLYGSLTPKILSGVGTPYFFMQI